MAALPKLRDTWGLLKDAGYQWLEAPRLGAALADYAAFSLAPLLVIVIAIVGFFWGQDAVAGRLTGEIDSVGGGEAGRAVETMVASANSPPWEPSPPSWESSCC
jgi:membrane protein